MDILEKRIITQVSEEELVNYKIGLNEVLALYKTESTGVINVGKPALMPYRPQNANMYGYEDSTEKGLFFTGDSTLKDLSDRAVFEIEITPERTICDNRVINGFDETLDSILSDNKVAKNIK